MAAVKAKGALWGANASLLQSLAVGDMNHGPTEVDVILDVRGSANKTPAKSTRNQCYDLYITPLVGYDTQKKAHSTTVDVTLNVRRSANEMPAKNARNQCSDLHVTPLAGYDTQKKACFS